MIYKTPLIVPISLIFILFMSFIVACTPIPTRVTVAPTLTPAPTLRPSPTPTSTPIPPTPTSMPSPTLAPQPTLDAGTVISLTTEGKSQLQAANIDPLCLRWEDTDGDGQSEWLGLYHQPQETPQLRGFVLDGEAWYDLQALEDEDYGLGMYPTCELEVRDINTDGKIEILIGGHAEGSIDLLHVFVWNGSEYTLLALFEGKAGIRVKDEDGDLSDEIAVGYKAGGNLAWEAVYTWDGANYGWTWGRYRWFYLDRPHAYLTDTPEHAVISFYLAVDDRDLPGAYQLFSPAAQTSSPYETWAAGFATTLTVEVDAVHELSRDGNTALVVAQVRAYDNVDGRVIATLWDVEWTTTLTDAGWRLQTVTTDQLDRWEASYYQ